MIWFGSEGRSPWPGRLRFGWVILLLVLVPLKDVNLVNASAVYEHARQLFLRGNLEQSQHESERGYRRFRDFNPEFAAKFQTLEAEAMEWRGMYEEALRILTVQSANVKDGDEKIEKLSLEGAALTGLQQFPAAERRLTEADSLCKDTILPACGGVSRARGVLAMKHGQFADAEQLFRQSRQFALQHSDRWLEAVALLNLGAAALQEEHYDEALDWSKSAYRTAAELGGEDIMQSALGNQGWAYFVLGDSEKALELFTSAEKQAARLGDTGFRILWLATTGDVYASRGEIAPAETAYRHALKLAHEIGRQDDVLDITTVLGQAAIASGSAREADSYAEQVLVMARQSNSRPDMMDAVAIQMQAAALRGDTAHAKQLLREVETAPESQTSMKWASELAMARLYEAQGQAGAAQSEYTTALGTFEAARAQLKHEDSQLPFVANATRIYDDYIHFLVQQGKPEEALLAADQSRARTLSEGLGEVASEHSGAAQPLVPTAVARKANATLLFYWLGEKQSYLWAITPRKTEIFPLPAKAELTARIERYRKTLQGPEDPIAAGDADGRALYAALVSPVAHLIDSGTPVMILADGALCQLNFETLIAPPDEAHMTPHYWIEDVAVVSAPSLAMLAAAKPSRAAHGKLLLVGDAISPDPSYPQLEYAAMEMRQVERHFPQTERAVFAREQATPASYLASNPNQYAYIHFVSHGVASQTDPLDSAIILSRASTSEDSFKLYAREIMQHPIDARLVTISACYGSGTRAYVGEGLVGLSWAFLHAGAHNAIGALWEASDRSTAQLMDVLYQRLEAGDTPGTALRQAKLTLLHSNSSFRKPFYWAPFQMYSRL